MSFWKKLKGPIYALAPMEDVTDTVFRRIVASCGRPTVMFTEFTSTEGMQSVGQARIIHRLKYTETERPIVAQVWGITPQNYYDTAKLVKNLGFDGIDINMGCPVKKVIKLGACSALIKNPNLAKEIILATKEGAGNLPVSVKTRIGFNSILTEEWLGFLLQECNLDVLTIHGRTVKEESNPPNHWDEIGKAVQMRDSLSKNTLIIGNGDISDLNDADQKIQEYNLDGIMIGRGIFKNPWLFNRDINLDKITAEERIQKLLEHVTLYEQTWGKNKSFNLLKRFFKIYITNFPGALELRSKLMETHSLEEVEAVISAFLS